MTQWLFQPADQPPLPDDTRIPVAVYLRVSSDDQRDRETIKTQRDAIDRWLAQNPEYRVYRYYVDDGVSGTIPFAQRPAGRDLVADAKAGYFKKIIVLRASRLGREESDLLTTYNLLVDVLGIELIGVAESLADRTIFGFQSIMAGYARRQFLADSARGMDRAAREGRYTGGIVPLGYRVQGRKEKAFLLPDDGIVWADWTAEGLVQRLYHWVGVEGHSCRWVANHLNDLGVPTAYQRDGRGVRGKRTQGLWRPSRIRNLLINPTYKGVLQYARRRSKNSKRTEIIEAAAPAIVALELWEATQQVLHSKRIMPRRSEHVHLLRSVMVCGICGLHYIGTFARPGIAWYRCNGGLVERGPIAGKCPSKGIRSDWLEPVVWSDIETWLRNPGDLLAQLDANQERDQQRAALEAERITLEHALENIAGRRKNAQEMRMRDRMTDEELDSALAEIAVERRRIEDRLALLATPTEAEEPAITLDLLEELRRRLDEGELDETTRHDIVLALVSRIVVYTEVLDNGKKQLRLRIDYRFPDAGCSPDDTGTDSLHL